MCTAMRFVLWCMELKFLGVESGPARLNRIFSKQPNQRSKVIQRSSCFRNALLPSNLVERTPHWRVMHLLGSRDMQGSSQPGVKLFRNALWPTNLVERTPNRRVMHCWGQRLCRGQPGVKLHRKALWLPNLLERTPDQRVVHWWCQRSRRDQPRSTRCQISQECPLDTKFDGKNPRPKIIHCWD